MGSETLTQRKGKAVAPAVSPQNEKQSKQSKKEQKIITTQSKGFISPVAVAILVLTFVVVMNYVFVDNVPSITGPAAYKKPFRTFSDFYPFYRTEHTNYINRVLHFIGTSVIIIMFAVFPSMIPSIASAGCVGYVCCGLFQGLEKGFLEFGLMLLTGILVHRISTGKVKHSS